MKKIIPLLIISAIITSCSTVKEGISSSHTVEFMDSVPMSKAKILENIKNWSCKLTKNYQNYHQDIYDEQADLPYKIYIDCITPTQNKTAKIYIEIEVVDSLLLCQVKCNRDKNIPNQILNDFRNSF